jgi:hypothetical protein
VCLWFIKCGRCRTRVCSALPVTGGGGPYSCETSRLPHFLDNRLTDGGEVVSSGRPSPPVILLVLISVRSQVDPRGHSATGRIRSIEESNDHIGDRTRDLPACSIVRQATTLLWRYRPIVKHIFFIKPLASKYLKVQCRTHNGLSIILKFILNKWDMRTWNRCIWLRLGPVEGLFWTN